MEDHLARLKIVHVVLARAQTDPDSPSLFDDIPDFQRLFGEPAGIYRLLRHRWSNHFEEKLGQVLAEGRPFLSAFHETDAEHPVLRAVMNRLQLTPNSHPAPAVTANRG